MKLKFDNVDAHWFELGRKDRKEKGRPRSPYGKDAPPPEHAKAYVAGYQSGK